MLQDHFQRNHNYLRISLTDACNLRCFYCMPEEDFVCTPNQKLMQPEEILAIAKTFVNLGVNKIRLTGGEPLVRKEFKQILQSLSTLPVSLHLTTNGIFLDKYLEDLKAANLRSVNISLDTLDANNFFKITRRDDFEKVKNNIQLLLENNFHVKINMVVMREVNTQEILEFARWSVHQSVHVRFIEFMPFDGNKWDATHVFTKKEILETIASEFNFIPFPKVKNETSSKYFISGAKGSFAIISTLTNPFCDDCNRLRLTADGKLKNCLFAADETDLLTALRNGEDFESKIKENISRKKQKFGGQWENNFEEIDADKLINRSMINIGG